MKALPTSFHRSELQLQTRQQPDHLTKDDKHIAVRLGKALHQLTRVPTTTGANGFENRKYGLRLDRHPGQM